MKVLDILNSPWAIDLQTLRDMQSTYFHHLQREKIDFSALSPKNLGNEKFYSVDRGVAVIPISGVLTPGSSFFSMFFGGSSYRAIQSAITRANADSSVENILLNMDSPGGTVKMGFETAEMIRNSEKSVYTFSDGQLTSGAMLLASPSKEIRITGKTNPVGSIGVIATHLNLQKWDERMGVEYTEIVSGKYKNIYSDTKPLSEEGKQSLQEEVDYLFSLFADDIATDRNIDVKTIVNWQAKVFIGQQAIDAGLVDGASTLSDFLDEISKSSSVYVGGVSTETKNQQPIKEDTMSDLTMEALKAKQPDLYKQIFDAGKAEGLSEGKETGIKQGAEDERARITAIHEAALPGQDELTQKCIEDGISAGDAAIRFLAAEKEHLNVQGQALEDEKPEPVSVDTPPLDDGEDQKKVEGKSADEQIDAVWEANKDLQSEFGENKEAFAAFFKANAKELECEVKALAK